MVAVIKAAESRRRKILAWRAKGVKTAEIAARLGVNLPRAYQLSHDAENWAKRTGYVVRAFKRRKAA